MSALQKLRLLIGRAVINLVDDTQGWQRMQMTALDNETRDGVARMQNFGQTSNPLPGAQGLFACVAGSRDNARLIAVDDPRHRPKGLKPGETATYNAHGVTFRFMEDGRALLECDTFVVAAHEILLDAPETTCTGTFTVEGLFTYQSGMNGQGGEGGETQITGNFTHSDGDLSSNGKVLHTHDHPDSHGGNTGAPN